MSRAASWPKACPPPIATPVSFLGCLSPLQLPEVTSFLGYSLSRASRNPAPSEVTTALTWPQVEQEDVYKTGWIRDQLNMIISYLPHFYPTCATIISNISLPNLAFSSFHPAPQSTQLPSVLSCKSSHCGITQPGNGISPYHALTCDLEWKPLLPEFSPRDIKIK